MGKRFQANDQKKKDCFSRCFVFADFSDLLDKVWFVFIVLALEVPGLLR
jgi:hypothetical protein